LLKGEENETREETINSSKNKKNFRMQAEQEKTVTAAVDLDTTLEQVSRKRFLREENLKIHAESTPFTSLAPSPPPLPPLPPPHSLLPILLSHHPVFSLPP